MTQIDTLSNEWVLRYDSSAGSKQKGADEWKQNLKVIASITSVQDFWGYATCTLSNSKRIPEHPHCHQPRTWIQLPLLQEGHHACVGGRRQQERRKVVVYCEQRKVKVRGV